jgi:hypothetical protein
MDTEIMTIFLIENYNDKFCQNIETALRTKYDQNWDGKVTWMGKDKNSLTFTATGENFRFDVHIGFEEGPFDDLKKYYMAILIDDTYLEYDETEGEKEFDGIKNRVGILMLMMDVFDFIKPLHGFGSYSADLMEIYGDILEGKVDPTTLLFGVNFFGWDLVKRIGIKKFDNLSGGKIKKTDAGLVYAVLELAYFGPNIVDFPKRAKIVNCPNEIEAIEKHLGLKWYTDLIE